MGCRRWRTIRDRRARRVTYGWLRSCWGGIWRLRARRLRLSVPDLYIDIHRYIILMFVDVREGLRVLAFAVR